MNLIVCALVVTFQAAPVDPVKVDEAINRGIAQLRKAEPYIKPWQHPFMKIEQRADELVLWTFVRAGVPQSDAYVQRMLNRTLESKLERTYNVALQAMVLDELDRVKYQGRIAQCAQFLADNQCQNGQWHYGEAVAMPVELENPKVDEATGQSPSKEKPKVVRRITIKKRSQGPERGCNSNSQYAAMGIRACAEAGITFEPQVLKRALGAWEQSQKDDGGWCYGMRELDHPKHESYGAMTAGGAASIVIFKHLLGEKASGDKRVEKSFKWLTDRFSVSRQPGKNENGTWESSHYYYLYGLERACAMVRTEKLGTHAWYAEGATWLLQKQKEDGFWGDSDTVVMETCFAILFLRRATLPLEPVPTGDKKR